MRLVWHSVAKDLRHLRWPWAVWLALVLAHTALLASDPGGASASAPAFANLGYFAGTWNIIVRLVGFLLAAWLVMADNLVDTRAFWRTRPIAGLRLLAAKAVGATFMFSAAPVILLAPVWLALGFSSAELGRAAWSFATTQALLTFVAFPLAALTMTSGQFLVRLVAIAIVVPGFVSFAWERLFSAEAPVATGVVISRGTILYCLLIGAPALAVIHQYLTRRTIRSWLILAIAFAAIGSVRFVWFWDFSSLVPTELNGATASAPAGFSAHVDRVAALAESGWPERVECRVDGMLGGVPSGTHVRIYPSFAEWTRPGERAPLYRLMRQPGGPGQASEELVRQVAGLSSVRSGADQVWTVGAEELTERVERYAQEGRDLDVSLKLALMRGRRVGRFPLQVGAELKSGSLLTRVIGIRSENGNVLVRLKEREAFDPRRLGDAPPTLGPVGSEARAAEDAFILISHAWPAGLVAAARPVGAVAINSILVGQRELTFLPPTRTVNGRAEEVPDWEKDAVIVQVRFEPEAIFTHHVSAPAPAVPRTR